MRGRTWCVQILHLALGAPLALCSMISKLLESNSSVIKRQRVAAGDTAARRTLKRGSVVLQAVLRCRERWV